MNKEYEKMQKILKKEFGKHRKMYLATSFKGLPKAKIVNTFYCDNSFYIITNNSSDVVKEINKNELVSLCTTASFHKFVGKGVLIGHPLNESNKGVRNLFIHDEPNWYDESDSELCLVQVKLDTVFTYANKIGYNFNFETNELESFRFIPYS